MSGHAQDVTVRIWTSITNSTYTRWSSTVSTCWKSQAGTAVAQDLRRRLHTQHVPDIPEETDVGLYTGSHSRASASTRK
jgi:hypothetical protein